nr:hypothetical protein [Vulcanisaeta sp. JCM 16159]
MGYIDAHTHLVFKETITEELMNFAMREWGAPREAILMGVKDVIRVLDDANIDYVASWPSQQGSWALLRRITR